MATPVEKRATTVEYQKDTTKHNLELHNFEPKPHDPRWYKFFGNECPDCKATPTFVTDTYEKEEIIK